MPLGWWRGPAVGVICGQWSSVVCSSQYFVTMHFINTLCHMASAHWFTEHIHSYYSSSRVICSYCVGSHTRHLLTLHTRHLLHTRYLLILHTIYLLVLHTKHLFILWTIRLLILRTRHLLILQTRHLLILHTRHLLILHTMHLLILYTRHLLILHLIICDIYLHDICSYDICWHYIQSGLAYIDDIKLSSTGICSRSICSLQETSVVGYDVTTAILYILPISHVTFNVYLKQVTCVSMSHTSTTTLPGGSVPREELLANIFHRFFLVLHKP